MDKEKIPLYQNKQPNYKRPNKVTKLIRKYWLDWVVLLVMSGISLGVVFSPPLSHRLFAVEFGKEPISYEYAYPRFCVVVHQSLSLSVIIDTRYISCPETNSTNMDGQCYSSGIWYSRACHSTDMAQEWKGLPSRNVVHDYLLK